MVIIFSNSNNSIIIELVKITLTFFCICYIHWFINNAKYDDFINILIEQLTIAFAVMSFIAVTFKKGERIILKIYKVIDKYI